MRFIILLYFLITSFEVSAQNFFREDYDKNRSYILLANPTKNNIQTVNFLLKNKLLNLNTKKIGFVGIYHKDQNYNFETTAEYLQKEGIQYIGLHEIKEPITESELFQKNRLTKELKELFEISIGIFFFGGPDIPPSIYGEENTLSVVTDTERHYFESTFLFQLLGGYQDTLFIPFLEANPKYFITGFCLGLQTMNVATGGTLIQDIPAEVYDATTPRETINTGQEKMHRNYWQKISEDPQLAGINFHTIRFTEHPFFKKQVKTGRIISPLVYSSHHQAVEKLGKGLEVTAFSADSQIVEGLAHQHYPHVFSVQFHPEVPALYENREQHKIKPDDEPFTYHQLLGKENLKFHKKYWKYISRAIKKSMKK